jgi:hypothetical protein
MWPFANGKYRPVPGSIPGTELDLRGVKVTMTPLCLDDFVAIEAEFRDFDKQPMGKQMLVTAKAAHRSLLANQPEITLADVQRLIDVRNMHQVMRTLMAINELSETKPGEPRPASP